MTHEPKYPRIILTQEDGRWVAAAASFADETPKAYIQRVLIPIARAIVRSGRAIPKPFVPSPLELPYRAFSVDPSYFRLLLEAAKVEELNMKQFAEKHLVPVAQKEVIARVSESQKKAA